MCYILIGYTLNMHMSFYDMSFLDMIQGDNENIMEQRGIASFIDLLVIYLIYNCIVVFCLYTKMVLCNTGRHNKFVRMLL